ncbi:MAG: hypothetical protein QNJ20_01745 [Paracoccaceae bacterium]|nr:hypothetical protein [Paracoccaceae bacterium]
MTDHLVDADAVEHIAKRAETYLHLSRRVCVDFFGPEAAHDHVMTIATVASMMATLENAEIAASAQDKLTELLEKGDA